MTTEHAQLREMDFAEREAWLIKRCRPFGRSETLLVKVDGHLAGWASDFNDLEAQFLMFIARPYRGPVPKRWNG